MKCSHGIPFEVKCRGCFEDAMKRVSASQLKPVVAIDPEGEKQVFYLGSILKGIDKNPRLL